MTDPSDRALRALLASILSLVLAACGPGSGGTGTGSPVGFVGSQTSSGVIGGHDTVVELRVTQTSVDLLQCGKPAFSGVGLAAGTDFRITGDYNDGSSTRPAVLRVQADASWPDAATVTVTVTDSAGNVLVAPTPLSRANAGSVPACT